MTKLNVKTSVRRHKYLVAKYLLQNLFNFSKTNVL